MEAVVYSFFIIAGVTAGSYFVLRQRFSRLLQAEQDAAFALRNNEIQLLSEKQRLEAALKEREEHILQIRQRLSSDNTSAATLSSEVIAKDKQIQSLSSQMQHETQRRSAVEQELVAAERQNIDLRTAVTEHEKKHTALSSELAAKNEAVAALTAEAQQITERHLQTAELLSQKETELRHLSEQLRGQEEKLTALVSEFAAREELYRTSESERTAELERLTDALRRETELRSVAEGSTTVQSQRLREEEARIAALTADLAAKEELFRAEQQQRSAELVQAQEALRQESHLRTTAEERAQETIRELTRQVESLQAELGSTRSMNETLNSSRHQISDEHQRTEVELRARLEELEGSLAALQTELSVATAQAAEERTMREATDHALQESKHKLYSHIAELEQIASDRANAIALLQSEMSSLTSELTAAQHSIQSVFEQLPIPVLVVNELGTCEYSNDALRMLVGYGDEELNGKHFARLFPEEDRSFYEEQWKHTEDRAEKFRGETRVLAASGDTITASVNFVPLRPSTGMTKFAGFILDRTTELDARKHYADAQQREQELLDLKSRFIGMVNHHLRTSLVTVATNTELLERFVDKWEPERRYHAFLRINEAIRQMLELVRDVTFTTTVATEPYTLSIAPVDLEAVFQSTARALLTDLESQHHFILSEHGNIKTVPLDAALMRTIAEQVLSNAFKYSSERTDVNAHIERTENACIIKVSDLGIGIPAAEQKHLFSSFFRASNVSNIAGTGLGLTIVQQCAQLHGGSVTVNSELNKGTTVTITLPVPQRND